MPRTSRSTGKVNKIESVSYSSYQLINQDYMQLKRLGHVAICVQDIPKAVQFYQSLGMQLAWQDADWAYLKAGTDGLALLSPEYKQAANHFGFVFSDRTELDQHHAHLTAQGIKAGSIHDHRDGTASFYGKDLDGNTFEFLYEPSPSTTGS